MKGSFMIHKKAPLLVLVLLFAQTIAYCAAAKTKIFVVSSYNREYSWSQKTNEGLCAAMLKYGYLDNQQQVDEYTKNDTVESSKAIIKKEWMDTKRHNTKEEKVAATTKIMADLNAFKPDIVFLGDDNATNYIGNKLLDTETPVVFWGVDGLPVKYGLVDRMSQPGHNVTGVWQSGYYKESVELLHKLAPSAKTFAILAGNSETATAKAKQVQALANQGALPLKLVDTVTTDSFTEFKNRALELDKKVDAFVIVNHDTLKDDNGKHVEAMEVGRWYLENIKKPDAAPEEQFIKEGVLAAADDSGYKQGYMAFEMGKSILENGTLPGMMTPRAPTRGELLVNSDRAKELGISLEEHKDAYERVIEGMAAKKS